MSKIYENITELIGQTPIIKLRNLPEDSAEVYVKLEAFNPGGSVKDRIALNMIRQAEQDGRLKAGGTIIEPTSGNTGIGLAFAGKVKSVRGMDIIPEAIQDAKENALHMGSTNTQYEAGKEEHIIPRGNSEGCGSEA